MVGFTSECLDLIEVSGLAVESESGNWGNLMGQQREQDVHRMSTR